MRLTEEQYSDLLQKRAPVAPKRSKYGNVKVVIDNITFDSQKEGRRYVELKGLEKFGEIHFLKLQVPFEVKINNKKICKYITDFTYTGKNGQLYVEDVKSEITRKHPVYRLKKKMVEAYHDILIIEI